MPTKSRCDEAAGGLRQVERKALDIRRQRRGRGFAYVDGKGATVTDPATLGRIRALAIPPAYGGVRIARHANAHLQAVGRDDAGRLQYRYHPDWDHIRESRKEERLAAMCAALPAVRRRIARDLRKPGLPRDRVLAAVVTLIDRTHIRIGCEDYVHSGRSRGAATLTKRNLRCEGDRIHLSFSGKGGREIRCALRSAPVARVVRALGRLPGSRLFQYRGEDGRRRRVTAADANRYLQDIAGAPVTAKDFRTLAATAAAAEMLMTETPAASRTGRRRQVAAVVKRVADMLGNTPAVARKSYVHRRLIDAFESGRLGRMRRSKTPGLSCGEALVAKLMR
jgi:DNA topoisomerase-1